MYGVTWFPLKSSRKSKRVGKEKDMEIKPGGLRTEMCVILILGWKNILDQVIKPVYNPPVVHFMFNVPIFISFYLLKRSIWLPFAVRNKRRNPQSVQSVDAPGTVRLLAGSPA
ncbi:hypothetical protein FQA47_018575 [Oryzias melastigma]|uniref:Uncharacterized protein n=1 Tax=Oryzias melastigma TaxID=30732 RepID=A0A834BPQ2_ORYME|nr:hypothetical protein FQA47_018575 [Oryzias melastigma]